MDEIRVPTPHGECVFTFTEDRPSYAPDAVEKAYKRLRAALKPCCPNCRSSSAGHKTGSPACRRAWLKRSFGNRKQAESFNQRAAYDIAMRVQRGELAWVPYTTNQRYSTGNPGEYVSTEIAVAA